MKKNKTYATKKQRVEIYWKSLSIPERIHKINALNINMSAQTMYETMQQVYDAEPLHQSSE